VHKRQFSYKSECWIKWGVSVQRLPFATSRDMLIGKGKGKVHPRTGHEGPEGE
jgi:hypothetical protein